MKKWWLVWILALLMSGCGAQETFETIGNGMEIPISAEPKQIVVDLPADIATEVLQGETTGQLYFCDQYTFSLQTLQAGDLDRTLIECCGYSSEALQIMQTESDGIKRSEAAWSAAGEGTDMVGRIVVLDDGQYHYVMTVMADAQIAGDLAQTWNTLLRSAHIVEADALINTGS